MSEPITWQELRAAVAALHEGLLGARHQANEAVWNPPDDRRLDRIYVDAYADLRFEVDGLAHRAEALVERMAETAAPVRPLEAVLAGRLNQAGIAYVLRRAQLGYGVEADDEWDELRAAALEVLAVAGPVRTGHPVDQIADAFAARKPAEQTAPLAREVRTIRGFEVEFDLEDALGTWRFRCPAMDVVGGGHFTLEDAIRTAGEAIDFAMGADIEHDRLNAIDREGRRREAEASEQGGAR